MSDVASMIDHTLLKAEATKQQVDKITSEAIKYGFASVCINPVFVPRVRQALEDSSTKTCTVIGFPLGANTARIKATEATEAIDRGADEIDIVAHLPNLLAADQDAVYSELQQISTAARVTRTDVIIKIIVESAALLADVDDETAERRIACACAAVRDAGCDFIKTSTGFHPAGGASEKAVRLMQKHSHGLAIKASGGIRTADDANRMIEAGATRLGCSAGVAIVTGGSGSGNY